MAGLRDCQLCQLQQQEMKRIPASYIPISVKTGLSQILDPMRALPKNDYRYFAEYNGLTPQIVQWLDSQKTQFNTSSIIAILNYLSDRDGDRFTVYQVYKTLCHMKSDGQRIICEGMPEIRSLFHQGTRPGQENSEPASVNLSALPRERSPSPPPPYDSNVSQHSVYMAGGEGAAGLNDLGCSPQDVANRLVHRGQSNGYHLLDIPEGNGLGANIALSQHMAGRQHGRPVACQASFIPPSDPASGSQSIGSESSVLPANLPQRLDCLRFGRREAAENSSSFNNTEDGSVCPPSPPSYVESEFQHRRTQQRQPRKPHTTMEELKSPLEGPEVIPGHSPGPRLPRNIPPAVASGPCLCGGRQSSSSRPESFPKYLPSSYQRRHDATRPVSNNMYCSHSGDCSCYSYSEECGPFSIVSDVSAEGHPWITERHETWVKQPVASHPNGNLSPQQPTAPQNNCRPSRPRQQQSAIEIRTNGTTFAIRNDLSSKFVFVMAADIDETERLDQQVKAFCQELERYGIGHVVVRSTSQTPLVALHPSVIENLPPLLSDFRSVQKFVGSCYKRAAKVLMLVTPGYLLYADGCAEGSQKAETLQQKLMRKIQEKLKEEFCNRDIPFRIWPVLLHEMKAHRLHLPFFLSDAVYYWFPLKPGAENVMEVLVEDLCVRSADVKRSI